MKNRTLQDMPLTRKFFYQFSHAQLRREIVQMFIKLISRFYSLEAIDDETKKRFTKVLRVYEKKIAIYMTIKLRLGNYFVTALFIINIVLIGFFLPIFLGVQLKENYWFILVSIVFSLAGLFFYIKSISLLLMVFNREKAIVGLIFFVFSSVIMISLLKTVGGIGYQVVLGGTVFFLNYALLYFEIYTFALAEMLVRRLYVRQNPIAFIVDNYLEILYLVNESVFDWTDGLKRQNILAHLKDISNVVVWYLPSHINFQDSLVTPWYLDRLEKISSSIRLVETKILMPNKELESELVPILQAQLMAFVSGCWGDFQIEEMPKVTRPQRFLYVWHIVKEFLTAVLPISVALLFQQTDYTKPIDTVVSSIVGILLVWMVIRLIGILSPSALNDIGKLKDVATLFYK